ncbi:Ig heavy chain [Clarias magur]|uniref:Ig heavy chain n=1 Tax=Clarias magur TaxID=1594786 RepID=A0A8J4XCR1_CLAMG|nr:Ig heavy chain [Clarias magur]
MLSQISIDAQQWNEGKEFTCSATHQNKTFNQTWSICKGHPNSEPRISLEKPPLGSILTDTHVTTSCVVETVLQPTVSWLVDGNEKINTGINSERQDESTVSNLTISVEDWTKSRTITCRAEHPCFKTRERTITIPETVQKRPTVEIRRSLADIGKRDSAVLECAASGLPSGELSVTFQANDEKFPEAQYVNLPEGQDTMTACFTIPKTHRTTNCHFTCQIQLSRSIKWKSNSIKNLFDDPSVKLSVVSNEDKSTSMIQKLLCSATGLNPEIKWLPESIKNNDTEVTLNADGRMKVSSELSVPEQEWKRGTTFTCQVSDQGGLKTVQNRTSLCAVTPDHARSAQVYLLGPSSRNMPEEDPVSVTCLLLGHRLQDFSVNCKVGTDNLSSNVTKTENHNNGTESVQRVLKVSAQTWNKHGTISCEVKHPCSIGQTYIVFKIKDPKCPTIRIRGPSDDELSGSHNTSLLCLIDGFLPADISVHWELNGTRLDTSLFTNSPAQFLSGSYSMHSALILSPLKREDGTFSCVVRHESCEKLIISNISNIYASINTNPPSVKLLQGQDELLCLVYGYSPSAINITWLLDSETVQHNGISSSAKGPDGKFIIKSHLNVKASEWKPGASYTCLVEHFTGQVIRTTSKAEFIEKAIYIDDNKSDINTADQAEETWNMACAFVILFIISLIYGCSVTLVKEAILLTI